MKEHIKKGIAFFISLILVLLTVSEIPTTAISENNLYCQATLEDNFIDNEIIVIIMPFANYYDYDTNDFSAVNCTDIVEISTIIIPNELSRILKITISGHSKQNVLDSILVLQDRYDIYSAEPNYTGTINFSEQSSSASPVSVASSVNPANEMTSQQAIDIIRINDAWEFSSSSSEKILIGVVDTGIDISHPYLSDFVNVTLSRDFTNSSSNGCTDNYGHGTLVAGVIKNALGGFSETINDHYDNIELVSLKIMGDNSNTYSISDIVAAFYYATLINIPILNISFGGYSIDNDIASLSIALNVYNGLFVCTAGNDNNDLNKQYNTYYPAKFSTMNHVITVGNSTNNDLKATLSNYGKNYVSIFAPGCDILSTFPIDLCQQNLCDSRISSIDPNQHNIYGIGYHTETGTSYAAPFVTSTAALMLSVNPELSAQEIKHIIMNVGLDYISDLEDMCVSEGRINAYKAVSHAQIHDIADDSIIEESSEGHAVTCNCCYFSGTIPHDLYIYSIQETEDSYECIVKCNYCSYTVVCIDPAEYSFITHQQHSVDCPGGCYKLFESHNFSTSSTSSQHTYYCVDCGYSYSESHSYIRASNGNLYSHNVKCSKCNYISRTELHTWVSKMTYYVCSKCNQIESNVPVIMIAPPPENELYGSSNENE